MTTKPDLVLVAMRLTWAQKRWLEETAKGLGMDQARVLRSVLDDAMRRPVTIPSM